MSRATSALRCARFIQTTRFSASLTSLTLALCAGISLAAQPNGTPFNGSIPGEFNVSPSGAATYSIPIEVPPGIGGMQPQLSLEYNSQSGNGLLGVGWSLGGLSSITRCPATLAQDGFIDGVDFDSNDRFCLDGQRLVAVPNLRCPGGTGEYRTENDSYSSICSYGNQGSGPLYFKVYAKSGQTYDYGSVDAARISSKSGSDILSWSLYELQDTLDSFVRFHYFKDATQGIHRLERIEYTKNLSAGLLSHVDMTFEYESRHDQLQSYVTGTTLQIQDRLDAIVTKLNGAEIRRYSLTYSPDAFPARSRLISVSDCSGADCKSPIEITWTAPLDGRYSSYSTLNAPTGGNGSGYTHLVDLTGDGISDVLTHSAAGLVYVFVAKPDGTFEPYKSTSGPGGNGEGMIEFGDIDGNGLTDMIKLTETGPAYVFLSKGDGTFHPYQTVNGPGGNGAGTVLVADVTDDGRADLLKLSDLTFPPKSGPCMR